MLELHPLVGLVGQGVRLDQVDRRRFIRALAGQVVGAVLRVRRGKLPILTIAPAPVAVAPVLVTTLSVTRLLRGL
jgi:hypothetical protein